MDQSYIEQNKNSGVLMPTAQDNVFAGRMQFEDNENLQVRLELRGSGETHKVTVHERDQDGLPIDEPIAEGTVKGTTGKVPVYTHPETGNVSKLAGRGKLVRKLADGLLTLRIVIWRVQRPDNTSFFQLKPDTRETHVPDSL